MVQVAGGPRGRRRSPDVANALVVLAALGFAALMFAVGIVVGRHTGSNAGGGTAAVAATSGESSTEGAGAAGTTSEVTSSAETTTAETTTAETTTAETTTEATTTEATTTEATTTGTGGGTTTGEGDGAGGGTPAGSADAGKSVFASAGCGSCHTLKAAGSNGQVGPNLDEAKPDAALVRKRVTNGMGVMPSFKDQLTEEQIRDVAAFVSSSAGS